ncbi:MAG: transcriptional regulator [Gammaproteobacteria bacterium]|jgi:DNA-binding transcriptional MerR regulator|nr:transcriptional regulator [Gammaproteobacteria bacterium]|tara:strand:- start:71 stop:472 length:402 start_codon:yes stop_codon:yes gene_type:complete
MNEPREEKSPQAFKTIREVSETLEVPQHVLRFWETKFKQLRPLKRGGGRRYYRNEDVELLKKIKVLLYSDGYTIKGVQKLFIDSKSLLTIPKSDDSSNMLATKRDSSMINAEVETIIQELNTLRDMLRGKVRS